jgi:hypothetical protein
MDLVLQQHPDEFNNYAKRDAEVSVEWLCRFLVFAADWHAHKTPLTVGSLAVHKVISIMEATPNLDAASFLGRMRNKRGGLGDALPELRGIQATAADCFHGGRNESYEHGFIRGHFRDFDLSGAYTSAMALFREIDWAKIERTTDLERLAVLDQPTFARVDFEFPPGTRFPCLPIDGAGYGLVYPLSGSCDCPGAELVVARNMAAKIIVREGIVLNWLDPNSPRPFVEFAKTVNKSRKQHQKGSALELLAKEAGNSAYGKIAQAVGSMKTKPVHRKVFDTRDGVMATLPASPTMSRNQRHFPSASSRAKSARICTVLSPRSQYRPRSSRCEPNDPDCEDRRARPRSCQCDRGHQNPEFRGGSPPDQHRAEEPTRSRCRSTAV